MTQNVNICRSLWGLLGGMTKNNGPIETTLIKHPNNIWGHSWGHSYPCLFSGILINRHSIISKIKPNNKNRKRNT